MAKFGETKVQWSVQTMRGDGKPECQTGCKQITMTTTTTARLERLNRGWNRFVVAARSGASAQLTHTDPLGHTCCSKTCYGQPLHRVTQTRWLFKARSVTYDGGRHASGGPAASTPPLIIRRNTISVRRHCEHRYRSSGDDDDDCNDDSTTLSLSSSHHIIQCPAQHQFQSPHIGTTLIGGQKCSY